MDGMSNANFMALFKEGLFATFKLNGVIIMDGVGVFSRMEKTYVSVLDSRILLAGISLAEAFLNYFIVAICRVGLASIFNFNIDKVIFIDDEDVNVKKTLCIFVLANFRY